MREKMIDSMMQAAVGPSDYSEIDLHADLRACPCFSVGQPLLIQFDRRLCHTADGTVFRKEGLQRDGDMS